MDVYELPPERLGRWLQRWAGLHEPVAETRGQPTEVVFRAQDGSAVRCAPPLPPLSEEACGIRAGFEPGPLLAHVARERTVGVLLVRLGGFAAGVFVGDALVASKVGRRLVHGRHRAGGSSQGRFARRREGQARVALQAAADVAARLLVARAESGQLEAVVLGGDHRALAAVLEDTRLAPVRALASERILAVADPRLDVLKATPGQFRATLVRAQEGPGR